MAIDLEQDAPTKFGQLCNGMDAFDVHPPHHVQRLGGDGGAADKPTKAWLFTNIKPLKLKAVWSEAASDYVRSWMTRSSPWGWQR